jgi:methyltransferase (TIGR00027 family)
MEHQGPSRTAIGSAMHRAAHLLLDNGEILADPFARAFAGYASDAEMLQAIALANYPAFPRMRVLFALRNRFAEDQLTEAMTRDIRQYLILGAGLDSFAYRRPDLMSSLDVFEVDHPASQRWKRERLAELGITAPAHLHYLAIDFERQTLAACLSDSAVDLTKPVFLSVLGVTQYLTRAAFLHTLGEVATTARGSEIVLQYVVPPATLAGGEADLVRAWIEDGKSLGEPWLSFYEPSEMERHLTDVGFGHFSHLGAKQAAERYLAHREDGFLLPGYSRLIHARLG